MRFLLFILGLYVYLGIGLGVALLCDGEKTNPFAIVLYPIFIVVYIAGKIGKWIDDILF